MSESEARATLIQRRDFLRDLFRQEKDPFYSAEKWTEECLSANQIGDVSEDKNQLSFIATLMLNGFSFPGHCPGRDAKPMMVVSLFCRDNSVLREYRCPPEECRAIPWDDGC